MTMADDNADLLNSVERLRRRTNDALKPGTFEFGAVITALLAANLVSEPRNRFGLVVGSVVAVLGVWMGWQEHSLRRRLGGVTPVWSYVAIAGTFAATIVNNVALNGTPRDTGISLILGVAMLALGLAERSSWLIAGGVALLAVVPLVFLPIPDWMSLPLGMAFGVALFAMRSRFRNNNATHEEER